MPKLIEYVSIGICSGYGDGDFRVSMAVCDLSPADYNELRVACVTAIGVMENMRRRHNETIVAAQQKSAVRVAPLAGEEK